MSIRHYNENDLSAVLQLLRKNTPEYFALDEEAHYIEYLRLDSDHYYVMEIDGVVVGCGGINYFPNEQVARISWDIVHPDHQGKGIGKQLILFRIARIKKNPEIKIIRVRTSQVVYKFYEKMGFVLEKVVDDFWSEGFHLYQMNIIVPFN